MGQGAGVMSDPGSPSAVSVLDTKNWPVKKNVEDFNTTYAGPHTLALEEEALAWSGSRDRFCLSVDACTQHEPLGKRKRLSLNSSPTQPTVIAAEFEKLQDLVCAELAREKCASMTARTKLQEITAQYSNQQAEHEALQSTVTQLSTDASSLQDKNATLRNEVKDIAAQKKVLEVAGQASESRIRALEEQATDRIRANESLSDEGDNLRSQLTRLEADQTRLQQSVEDFKLAYEREEQISTACRNDREAAIAQLTEVRTESEKRVNRYRAAYTANKMLWQKQLNVMTGARDGVVEELHTLSERYDQLTIERNSILQQQRSLEDELKQLQVIVEDQKSSHQEDIKKEKAATDCLVKQLEKRLIEVNMDSSQMDTNPCELRRDNDVLQSQNTKAEESLRQTSDLLSAANARLREQLDYAIIQLQDFEVVPELGRKEPLTLHDLVDECRRQLFKHSAAALEGAIESTALRQEIETLSISLEQSQENYKITEETVATLLAFQDKLGRRLREAENANETLQEQKEKWHKKSLDLGLMVLRTENADWKLEHGQCRESAEITEPAALQQLAPHWHVSSGENDLSTMRTSYDS